MVSACLARRNLSVPNPIMSSIQLIRHAESEGNAGLPTHDPASIPLTQRGHEQATALAATFTAAPDLIVVSPFIRTQQTAAPLITLFPEVPVEEWAVQEFTYLNPIKYIGTTETQRGTLAQGYWNRCDPHGNDGGGAESFADLITRIDALETRLWQYVGKSVVIFMHGFSSRLYGSVKRNVRSLLMSVSWPLFGMQDGVIHCQIRVEKTSKFAKQ